MLSRRLALQSIGAVSAALTANAQAQQICEVFTPATQSAVTPDGALKMLKEGDYNVFAKRIIDEKWVKPNKRLSNSTGF